jgi:signal transduction histidine kinase
MSTTGAGTTVRTVSTPLRTRAVDLSAPVAVAVLGAVDVAISGSDFRAPEAVDLAFMLGVALPLYWRRRRPLAALIAFNVVAGAYVLGWYIDSQPPIQPFVAGLVASFALGAHATDPQLRAGIGVLAAAIVATGVPQVIAGQQVGDVLPAAVWWFGAVAAGRFVRGRQRLVALLGDRAARLERERETQAAQAVLEERARIARELHDVIAHSVSVIVVQASAERRTLAAQQASTAEVLEEIESAGRDVLAELRRLLGVMRAPGRAESLSPQPGLDALDSLLHESRKTGQLVDLRVEGQPRLLSAGIDLAAYRIIQEALTNTRRHAPGARSDVTLRWRAGELAIEIVDDGPGPNPSPNGAGHGLVGMTERATLYGGSVQTGSAGPTGGFRVRARLPLQDRLR